MLTVQQRFDAASSSYDEVAGAQQECAEILVAQLVEKWPDLLYTSILDLGAGTGFMSQLALSRFPDSYLTLNDLSPNMLQSAKEKLGAHTCVQYALGDLEKTVFDFHELVLSNLALQWVDELESAIQLHYMNSNVFAFSCLMDGTFSEWGELFKQHGEDSPVKQYPKQSDLERFLLSLNPKEYEFKTQELSLPFENAQAFMVYLKKLGASLGIVKPSISTLKRILKSEQQPFKMTYRVFFGLLKRI
jgi:malonyl-CoA O-methyltransferase